LIEIKQIEYGTEAFEASLVLRNNELRIPLGLTIWDDDLEAEKAQIHFAAFKENEIVGCVVLVILEGNQGKLRQMVTHSSVRGKGIGIQLVEELETYCISHGIDTVVLHARSHACGFYAKLGYIKDKQPFLEVGIEHYKMAKQLNIY
jgi:predicted GNAT family N-acyltransferase